ncbi:hypothetical protein GCM10025865_03660 [Paraoerskovia sediminicola]|uniref:Aquaporin Z n=1 Tax=Paraoerskovia sediminicola TaxID=1138587 RepID=A0ABN6X8R7_9CELL|nr:aquaporin [Paraoerskovia sediminicola]BDZ41067.1 hypothetical protein GCM10025865_03660 [Paraoerskovia sediminicola]
MAQDFAAPAATAPSPDPYATPDDGRGAPAAPAPVVEHSVLARLGAEVFGTFFLVLAICGVALYSIGGLGPGALGGALAGGLALMAGIAAVGHVSGGHFNPAVTLGAALAGRTRWLDVPLYWVAQLVGGAAATLVLFATIPSSALPVLQQSALISDATKSALMGGVANGYAEHSPLAGSTNRAFAFDLVSALLIEVVLTAVFVGVILAVTDKSVSTKLAPVAIGLTLTVVLLIAGPFTNGSVNPARSTAAAIFAGDWALSQLWLFWVAPLLGAAIAGLFYRVFTWRTPVQDDLLSENELAVGAPAVADSTAVAAPPSAVAEQPATAPAEPRTETEAAPVAEPTEPSDSPASTETADAPADDAPAEASAVDAPRTTPDGDAADGDAADGDEQDGTTKP